MNIVLFEDDAVTELHPVSLGRPAYAISCGGYRLIDLIRELDVPSSAIVRPHLQEIQRIDYPWLEAHVAGAPEPLLLVNARLVPSVRIVEQLRDVGRSERSVVVRGGNTVAAVLLTPDLDIRRPTTPDEVRSLLRRVQELELTNTSRQMPLFELPHDVIRHNMEILNDNLSYRITRGEYREIRSGVFVEGGAELGDHVVTDTKVGPIVLGRNARVGPFCYLQGPAFLGHGARVAEHAAIKDHVSVGHTTKIGGEVEASVVEPFSNKQHHGFLGHSYVGSWINLGAGTCNSDLKNTYGKVNMEYRGRKVATDMQFVGCIMGDYSKTAINTGIFTGKTIGVCCMLYGFVTANVPSFVNYARLFGQVTELPPEVMIATQKRMFGRRNVDQRPCDVRLIHDMYLLTREERQLADEPLTL